MFRTQAIRIWAASVVVAAWPAAALGAQSAAGLATTWPVDTVAARFARTGGSGVAGQIALAVVYLPRAAFAARQDSLLQALERIAREDGDPATRDLAIRTLAAAGYGGGVHDEIPGVMPRLVRIDRALRASDPGHLRATIRDVLPRQADRAGAVAFLREIAIEPDPRGRDPVHGYIVAGDPRIEALRRLSEMGAEGRRALQEMHRSGAAKSPQARLYLSQMAERAFPVRDAIRDTRAP